MLLTHALALSANQLQEKSPYEYAHSVRIELAKMILVGTRITYQATRDAGSALLKRLNLGRYLSPCCVSLVAIELALHQNSKAMEPERRLTTRLVDVLASSCDSLNARSFCSLI